MINYLLKFIPSFVLFLCFTEYLFVQAHMKMIYWCGQFAKPYFPSSDEYEAAVGSKLAHPSASLILITCCTSTRGVGAITVAIQKLRNFLALRYVEEQEMRNLPHPQASLIHKYVVKQQNGIPGDEGKLGTLIPLIVSQILGEKFAASLLSVYKSVATNHE